MATVIAEKAKLFGITLPWTHREILKPAGMYGAVKGRRLGVLQLITDENGKPTGDLLLNLGYSGDTTVSVDDEAKRENLRVAIDSGHFRLRRLTIQK